ncbi:UNVERIFIED_CONTAM: hypothetical protein HDU68_012091, partial [Siphonaria sp. JEL0065]
DVGAGGSTISEPKPSETPQPLSGTSVPLALGSVAGILSFACIGVYVFMLKRKAVKVKEEQELEAQKIAARVAQEEAERDADTGLMTISGDYEVPYNPLGNRSNMHNLLPKIEDTVVIASTGNSVRPRVISNDPNDWTIDDCGQWIAVNGGHEEGELVIHAQKINGRALLVLPLDTIMESFTFKDIHERERLQLALLELRAINSPTDAPPTYTA